MNKIEEAKEILDTAVEQWLMRKPALITNHVTCGHRAEIDKFYNACVLASQALQQSLAQPAVKENLTTAEPVEQNMTEAKAYEVAGQILDGSIKVEPHIGQQIADRIAIALVKLCNEAQPTPALCPHRHWQTCICELDGKFCDCDGTAPRWCELKDVFNPAMQGKEGKMEETNFGWALANLKAGKKVARTGWNGKGMWLTYLRGSGGTAGPTCTCGDWQANENIFSAEIERLPFIAMKTAQDNVVPWLASQMDILADDWYVVS